MSSRVDACAAAASRMRWRVSAGISRGVRPHASSRARAPQLTPDHRRERNSCRRRGGGSEEGREALSAAEQRSTAARHGPDGSKPRILVASKEVCMRSATPEALRPCRTWSPARLPCSQLRGHRVRSPPAHAAPASSGFLRHVAQTSAMVTRITIRAFQRAHLLSAARASLTGWITPGVRNAAVAALTAASALAAASAFAAFVRITGMGGARLLLGYSSRDLGILSRE